jgi:hypothetical protein
MASPVKGLTADIMVCVSGMKFNYSKSTQTNGYLFSMAYVYVLMRQIRTAEIAYNRDTTFERYSPGQKDGFIAIVKQLTGKTKATTSLSG